MSDYLCHHGIKGQKWGVRQYQNPDGTLTEAGKNRYRKTEAKIANAKTRASKYATKSARNKAKASIYKYKRDKKRARRFQTDISIWRANQLDRKRARAKMRSLKYDAKAKTLKYKAKKWEEDNQRLLNTPIADI